MRSQRAKLAFTITFGTANELGNQQPGPALPGIIRCRLCRQRHALDLFRRATSKIRPDACGRVGVKRQRRQELCLTIIGPLPEPARSHHPPRRLQVFARQIAVQLPARPTTTSKFVHNAALCHLPAPVCTPQATAGPSPLRVGLVLVVPARLWQTHCSANAHASFYTRKNLA
jgi:hypothetical protein